MNVEFINPFIEASKNIIYEMTGLKANLGKVYSKSSPYKTNDIGVIIGLTGKINGSVVVSFDMKVACKIASLMMGGMEVNTINEIAKSAIAELGNMILGNTATVFSKKKIDVDITTPTVFVGQNLHFSTTTSSIICVPLVFETGGSVELDISYN